MVLSTAFEREYGPSPHGHGRYRVARGIYVQVCHAYFIHAYSLVLMSACFQGIGMSEVGDADTRPKECADYPCPCLEVRLSFFR